MANQKPETVFDLDTLLRNITASFTAASLDLQKTFEQDQWRDHPFTYHMPRMNVAIRLELSHSDGKVKGVFKKRSTEARQELASTIEIEVVSVPRFTDMASEE